MSLSLFDPRHDITQYEDLITPMHHHTPGQDYLVATTSGGRRRVSVREATRIVAAANTTPGVDEVDQLSTGYSRRNFLRAGSMGAGVLAVAATTPRMAFAAGAKDLLVVVFLRGGVDGLSAVVPVTDSAYYAARPQIAVQPGDTFALNGSYGMNQHLSALKPLWDDGQVAVVLGSGNPDVTRSHFEDQARCEQAAPASMRSGWIGRHLATSSATHGTFRAITMGSHVALSMTTTAFETVAMSSVADLDIYTWNEMRADVLARIDSLFAKAGGAAQAKAHLTVEAINALSGLRSTAYTPDHGATYPTTSFGNGMKDIARMAKGGVGLEVAAIDMGDWDMHNALGLATNSQDWFSRNARHLATTLAAFATDLGATWATTTVVLMSEFGRRVQQNGDHGVDHGAGNVLWVLGGGINGGVYGTQPSLTPANLVNGDVPITTDYRLALSELVSQRLGNSGALAQVFPGYTPGTPLGIARPA